MLKGFTRGVIKDASGNIYHEEKKDNNIVLAVRTPLVKLLGGFLSQNYAQLPFVSQIKFGNGVLPPTIYQTGLQSPIPGAVKILPVAPTVSSSGLEVTFSVVFGEQEMNNTLMTEAGLFTTDNTMIARSVIGEYTKMPGMFFEFYWTIGFEE